MAFRSTRNTGDTMRNTLTTALTVTALTLLIGCPKQSTTSTSHPGPEPWHSEKVEQDVASGMDTDNDGVIDAQDSCLYDAEDPDGFEDTDGCPDNDNDKDGVLDDADPCPDEKEGPRWPFIKGCPSSHGAALQGGQIVLRGHRDDDHVTEAGDLREELKFAARLMADEPGTIIIEVIYQEGKNPRRVGGFKDDDETLFQAAHDLAASVKTIFVHQDLSASRIDVAIDKHVEVGPYQSQFLKLLVIDAPPATQ